MKAATGIYDNVSVAVDLPHLLVLSNTLNKKATGLGERIHGSLTKKGGLFVQWGVRGVFILFGDGALDTSFSKVA